MRGYHRRVLSKERGGDNGSEARREVGKNSEERGEGGRQTRE